MTQMVDFSRNDDPRDAIHRACHRLADGDLVAFPSETVYLLAANPLSAGGVKKLLDLQPNGRLALVLKSPAEIWDYATGIPDYANKLARRGWPGPLIIALPRSEVGGLFYDLEESIQKALKSLHSRVDRKPDRSGR